MFYIVLTIAGWALFLGLVVGLVCWGVIAYKEYRRRRLINAMQRGFIESKLIRGEGDLDG